MEYRKISNTDMEVTTITLGTWVFGGDCWGKVDDEQSIRVIEKAVDSGINIIDTAPIYGTGRSESVIGKALKKIRNKVYIATKCGLKPEGRSIQVDQSAKFIRQDLEGSLKRLGIETIDLYQIHFPDEKIPLEETLSEMMKFVEEGKVRYIGVSNFEKDLLEKAVKIAPVVSNQMHYSLLHRDIEDEVIPFCREKGISILAYGSLGGGILTGKYKEPPKVSKGDVKSFYYDYYREPTWSKACELVSTLKEIAEERGVPTSQVAVNWALSRNEVTTALVGCRTEEQLAGNVSAMDWELTEEELNRIQTKYDQVFTE